MNPIFLRGAVRVALVLGGLGLQVARAAPPVFWTEQERAVATACLAASQLHNAKVSGRPVVFDDSVGTTALLLSGRHPRPTSKNLSGRELCLFERKTGTAHVTDAENMGAARQ